MKISLKGLVLIIVIFLGVILTSCQAVEAEMDHHKLHVSSKMSNSIFLDLFANSGNKIYMRVSNTSTQSLGDLSDAIKTALVDDGYDIVENPAQADYILQVDVLQFGKLHKDYLEKHKADETKDDQAKLGAEIAGGTGYAAKALVSDKLISEDDVIAGAGAAVVGGLGTWLLDDYVENETYSLLTNIHIDEIKNHRVYKKYHTQIASKADKVDLKFKEARPILNKQLSHEISQIFGDDN